MKIALIQFRSKAEILSQEVEFILSKCDLDRENLMTFNAIFEDLSNLNINQFDGFIFGGSGEISFPKNTNKTKIVKDHVDELVNKIIIADKPSLFICLGFQLLALNLGREVVNNSDHVEVSTINVKLTNVAKLDPLFSSLPGEFMVQTGHHNSIEAIPNGCTLLITGKICPIQGYKLKKNIYAVQFHPEQSKDNFLERLKSSPSYAPFANGVVDSPESVKLIKNFVNLAKKI